VRVVVLAEEDRAPIAGAAVVVTESDLESEEQRGTTDAAGVAQFGGRAPGKVAAWAAAEGRVRSGWMYFDTAEHPDGSIEIVLSRGVFLEGIVLDAASGLPIAGARVVVEPGGSLDGTSTSTSDPPFDAVTTAEDGRFRVRVRPAEMATPRITARGHVPLWKTVMVPPGDAPRAPFEFRLEPGGRVSGTVKDPAGAVVAGAKVYAVPADEEMLLNDPDTVVSGGGRTVSATIVRTDAQGAYEIDGVSFGGVYRILARGEGWAASAPKDGVTTTPEAPAAIIDLALRKFGAIVLRLVDPEGRGVAAKTTVSAGGGWPEMLTTDASGVLRLEGRDPVRHAIDVTPQGFVVVHLDIDVEEGATAERTVTLDRGVAAAGRVVDERGEGVPGATVHVRRPYHGEGADLPPSDGEVKSGPDGAFRVAGLRPGPHIVSAYAAAGHTMAEDAPLEVPAEGVRIVMTREAKVLFRLAVPQGSTPPAAVYLFAGHRASFSAPGEDLWGGSATTLPFGKGAFELDFDAGTSLLRVLTAGFAPYVKRFEVKAGEDLDLGEIRLDPGLALAGRIEDISGAAVAGARVTTGEAMTPAFQTVLSGTDGSFRLEHLAPGKVIVSVDASGFLAEDVPCDVAVGGAAATVRLARGASLKIAVVDAEGRPVPGVSVTVRKAGAAADEDPAAREDADHRGLIEVRVPAGRWKVVAEDRDAMADCETKEGGAAEVRLVVK
jgi:protocatechuate 3,4-dioxygenase beta subunit